MEDCSLPVVIDGGSAVSVVVLLMYFGCGREVTVLVEGF